MARRALTPEAATVPEQKAKQVRQEARMMRQVPARRVMRVLQELPAPMGRATEEEVERPTAQVKALAHRMAEPEQRAMAALREEKAAARSSLLEMMRGRQRLEESSLPARRKVMAPLVIETRSQAAWVAIQKVGAAGVARQTLAGR